MSSVVSAVVPVFAVFVGVLLAVSFVMVSIVAIVRHVAKSATGPRTFRQSGPLCYARVDSLLTPAERSFYGSLVQATGADMVVVPKVRVADVLQVHRGPSVDGRAAFNQIAMKHFDFVICDRATFSPLYVVELNDSSHLNLNRAARDKFLLEACQAADLPFIQIKAQSGYSIAAIAGTIRTELAEMGKA